MLFVFMSREELVALPQLRRGVVAEIGVAEGEFSRQILNRSQPQHLHLIDPWRHHEDADYRDDPNNQDAAAQEHRFQTVSAAFAGDERVTIHRMSSTDAAAEFSDGQLDWVYIDGMHTRAGVDADLRAYAPRIRPGGFLIGHDYTDNPLARKFGFGVIEAVNAFVRDQGWTFLALTAEHWPTYVLCRRGEPEGANALLNEIIQHGAPAIEIRNYPNGETGFHHQPVKLKSGKYRMVPSF